MATTGKFLTMERTAAPSFLKARLRNGWHAGKTVLSGTVPTWQPHKKRRPVSNYRKPRLNRKRSEGSSTRDLTGYRFGKLTAISVHHSANHKRYWLCVCDCGNRAIVRQDQLVTGKTKTCGCYRMDRKKTDSKRIYKRRPSVRINGHNKNWNPLKHEHPRLYCIWHSMKSRCYYPKNKCYHCYGGRGISICDEWIHSFNNFATWALNNGYSDTLTIDRIDVDGNYSPFNCRWITMKEQQKNKRKRPKRKQQGAKSPTLQSTNLQCSKT